MAPTARCLCRARSTTMGTTMTCFTTWRTTGPIISGERWQRTMKARSNCSRVSCTTMTSGVELELWHG
eukprot:3979216-Lingulodinium_polyedra.AAC.1